jgi:hypothetical protein
LPRCFTHLLQDSHKRVTERHSIMPVRNGRSTKINSVRGAGRVQLPWEFKRRRVLTLPQPQQSRWISTTAKPRVQRCTGLAGHSESSVRGRPTDFELAGGCLFLHVSYKRVYVCVGGRTWERLPGVVVTLVGEFFEIAGNGVGNGLKGCGGASPFMAFTFTRFSPARQTPSPRPSAKLALLKTCQKLQVLSFIPWMGPLLTALARCRSQMWRDTCEYDKIPRIFPAR